jgi:hypothetical protein
MRWAEVCVFCPGPAAPAKVLAVQNEIEGKSSSGEAEIFPIIQSGNLLLNPKDRKFVPEVPKI